MNEHSLLYCKNFWEICFSFSSINILESISMFEVKHLDWFSKLESVIEELDEFFANFILEKNDSHIYVMKSRPSNANKRVVDLSCSRPRQGVGSVSQSETGMKRC